MTEKKLRLIELEVDFHDVKKCGVYYYTNKDEVDIDNVKENLIIMWKILGPKFDKMAKSSYSKKLNKYEELYFESNKWQLKYYWIIYLRPHLVYDINVEGSKYPFKLWLNPNVQDLFQAGHYTVEEIEQWFDGSGPVIENGSFTKNQKAMEAIVKGEKGYPFDYYAICKCGYIHHDGNRRGRNEMINGINMYYNQCFCDALTECPKCGKGLDQMVFSDDDPEHYTKSKLYTNSINKK